MLIITFQNDCTGKDGKANYTVKVWVNRRRIRKSKVEGHNRSNGWLGLLEDFVTQEKARYTRAKGRFGPGHQRVVTHSQFR